MHNPKSAYPIQIINIIIIGSLPRKLAGKTRKVLLRTPVGATFVCLRSHKVQQRTNECKEAEAHSDKENKKRGKSPGTKTRFFTPSLPCYCLYVHSFVKCKKTRKSVKRRRIEFHPIVRSLLYHYDFRNCALYNEVEKGNLLERAEYPL